MPPDAESESYVRGGLDGDEIRILGHANNGAFAVTDRRLIVGGPAGVGLDIPFATVRRIQFDLEPGRPASVAFVSNDPHDEVVLLSIPPEEYGAITDALLAIGRQLAALTGDHSAEGLSDYPVPAQ